MEHLFLSHELSIIAKEKGFDEPCFGWYSNIEFGKLRIQETVNYKGTNYAGIESCYLAPLYQQVTEWFRAKDVKIIESMTGLWSVYIDLKDGSYKHIETFKHLNAAIEEAFTLI